MAWIVIQAADLDAADLGALNDPNVVRHAHGAALADAVLALRLSRDELLALVKGLVKKLPEGDCNQLKMHDISAIQRRRKTEFNRLVSSLHGSFYAPGVVEPIEWTPELEDEARRQALSGPQ